MPPQHHLNPRRAGARAGRVGNERYGGRSLDLDATTTCWGGDPAADLYGDHLRAERLMLYTSAATADVARTLRIVPAHDGPIEVLDR